MKKIVVFLFIFFCFSTVWAKTPGVNPENLLHISNRGKSNGGLYNGTPFVKIEPTVGAPKPEKMSGWMDEEKKRLFGTTQITQDKFFQNTGTNSNSPYYVPPIQSTPEISYQPPFGQEKDVLYIPHTSDFISIIRMIDETTVSVEEFIYTVNPQNSLFSRTLSFEQNKNNNDGVFQLLKFKIDGKDFLPQISVNDGEIEIKNNEYLLAGYHSFYLKYITKNALFFQDGKGYIDFDITGYKWPFPINRLTIYVSFPSKIETISNGIFFGRNDAIIKNAYTQQIDSAGNTIYRINNPIPAFASVKINHVFNDNHFSDFSIEKLLNKYPASFLVIFVFGSIIIYLLLSVLYVYFIKNDKKAVKFVQSLHPIELNCLYNKYITTPFLSFYHHNPIPCKNKFLFQYAEKKWGRYLLTMLIYLKMSVKYWLTAFVIFFGGMYLSLQEDIKPSWIMLLIMGLIVIIFVFLFYYFIGIREYQRYISHYKKTLLNQNIFYGLTKQAVLNLFKRHYLHMVAIKSDAQWLDLAHKYNSQITKNQFTNEKQEEKNE
ncbi:MAG: DUF2207 domain-containing protein [Alphaproteobacteria bacterium]|nr:DUF2207 domain-containing protein [Alphaproteobacteria bacterium]